MTHDFDDNTPPSGEPSDNPPERRSPLAPSDAEFPDAELHIEKMKDVNDSKRLDAATHSPISEYTSKLNTISRLPTIDYASKLNIATGDFLADEISKHNVSDSLSSVITSELGCDTESVLSLSLPISAELFARVLVYCDEHGTNLPN